MAYLKRLRVKDRTYYYVMKSVRRGDEIEKKVLQYIADPTPERIDEAVRYWKSQEEIKPMSMILNRDPDPVYFDSYQPSGKMCVRIGPRGRGGKPVYLTPREARILAHSILLRAEKIEGESEGQEKGAGR